MKKQRLIPVTLLLLAGIVIGVLAAGQFGWLHSSNANVAETQAPGLAVPADSDFIQELNQSFAAVANAVNPSVVTVLAERVVQMDEGPFGQFRHDPFREFFGEDFFNRFFSPGRPDTEQRLRGLGSGVIVDAEEGYILTNNHVVRDADKIRIMMYNGDRFDAEIVGTDSKSDIAVIKVDAENLAPVRMGNSEDLKIGEWVIAIGSPLSENLARTVTSGIVSAKGRSNVGLADYEDFIQTDAAINPGNSGGALVNLRGELVGINTAIASRSGGFQGIGFAVPINMAGKVMDALITEGKVVRGWLGVYIQNIDENLAKAMDLSTTDGALVSSVTENSPAEKAGIKSGDLIQAIDGEKVANVTRLRNEIASRAPESEIELKILRDGKENKIQVMLGQLPEEDATPAMRQSSLDQLGFSVQTLDEQLAARLGYKPAEEGVVVTRINQASPAYQAGLRQGDVIKEINKKPVTTANQFSKMTAELGSGDNVLLFAKRGQNTFFVAFELN